MDHLNEEQVNLIRKEVDRQDIHFRHLAYDLVDHICCEIEELIAQGKEFKQAHLQVMQFIGMDGLIQIQQDTLYLNDKKYRIMKNSIKITGVAGMALLTLGALLKIQHLQGANILIVIGFFLLGAIFFPISMVVMRKESNQLERPLIYLTALTGGLAVIFSIMLKVVHWPGANTLFTIGYVLLGLVFLPLLLARVLKGTPDYDLKKIYIIGAVFLFLYMAGTCFKFNHFPGALIMLVIGSLGLTGIFFPLYSIREFKGFRKVEPRFILLCIGLMYFNLFNLLLAYN